MQYFFAFGYEKSGTTFLQMLLDSHPRANCPPEHQLEPFNKKLKTLLDEYEGVIKYVDDVTGRQGLRFDKNFVATHILRAAILAFATCGAAPGTTHCGLNDNRIDRSLDTFANLFPGAKFIWIVRDPRNLAISLHHHNMRTRPKYKERKVKLSNVVDGVAKLWAQRTQTVEDFAARPIAKGRFRTVRYEDLTGPDSAAHLTQLLGFLDLDADKDLVAKMLNANRFEEQKAKKPELGGFMRSGPRTDWRSELSYADVAEIEKSARSMMQSYGYETFTPA